MAGWDDNDRRGDDEWEDTAAPAGDEGQEPLLDVSDGEADRLDLDDDERLPWLESVEDGDDYEQSDTGRLIALLVGGLVILAALVGGIWWLTHRNADTSLQADGSVIEAPDAPYKEAPEDPGGKTFAGTGDTSYVVSEGQSRPPRLATDAAPTEPAAPLVAEGPAPAATQSAAPAGVGVQVGAFTSRESAETGWTRLSQQHDELFSGLKHRVVEGRADIGTVYRLQALAADRAAANDLCGRFKTAGVACQVKD
jgi:hypothetical protein